jgi:hypothetical protein
MACRKREFQRKPLTVGFCSRRLRGRDSIGDAAIAGDKRWSGAFGVNVDMVARSHCSVEMILLEDLQVLLESSRDLDAVRDSDRDSGVATGFHAELKSKFAEHCAL